MMDARREIRDAGELLAENDIVPLVPRDGDGMALANHACFTAAFAALSLDHAGVLLESAQAAAAMSLEGFGANLSVWQPAALDAREQPGQRKAVERLSSLLRGSRLLEGGAGRRLQDPLSVRTVAPVHGAVYASIEWARPVAEAEINGVSDNPVVDTVGRRVVPSTGFHTPLVTVAMHTVAHALQQLAVAQVARMSKLLSPRHCGLTPFLARDASDSNGFAPVLKIAEAHLAEIHRAAGPSALSALPRSRPQAEQRSATVRKPSNRGPRPQRGHLHARPAENGETRGP